MRDHNHGFRWSPGGRRTPSGIPLDADLQISPFHLELMDTAFDYEIQKFAQFFQGHSLLRVISNNFLSLSKYPVVLITGSEHLGAVFPYQDRIFDPNPAPARQINAGLDGNDGALRQAPLHASSQAGRLMDFQPQAVAQAMGKSLI